MPTPQPPMPPPLPPLTLIVATTPSLGIGFRGTLPWPPLKSDLAFFARVTKRPPPPLPPSHAPAAGQSPTRVAKNAVLMGRKTWESIPAKFRPLKGRINVVVSRKPQELDLPSAEGSREPVFGVGSVEEGLRRLQSTYPAHVAEGEGKLTEGEGGDELGRVFVIGGAEIYGHALRMEECRRILWTRLQGEWECDTFFPEDVLGLEGAGGAEGGGDGDEGKWIRRSTQEMEGWVGEEGAGGLRKEGEVEFEVCMLERGA